MRPGRVGGALASLLLVAGAARAQRQDVTVGYLRAAIGSIRDRTSVTVTGIYDGSEGLREARGRNLRGDGFSRFKIEDPESGFEFGSMYCHFESSVFDTLLKVRGRKVFRFSGRKGEGESNEAAVFVERVEALRDLPEPREPEPAEVKAATYRVTILDQATSNKTVLANVRDGQAYKVAGVTVTVEREDQ